MWEESLCFFKSDFAEKVASQELQTKNEAANSKLRQMVKDQNEAEQKKIQSQEIQAMIEKQTQEIVIKKKDVMADLDQVDN